MHEHLTNKNSNINRFSEALNILIQVIVRFINSFSAYYY